jgi:hypothetical protein
MRFVLVAASAALALGCGGSQATTTSDNSDPTSGHAYDISPAFRSGTVYTVRTETGSKISTASAKSEAVVVMESTREVSSGGVFRQAPLRWRETVKRVTIDGDKSWDSEGDEPPATDLVQVAALAGSTYTVDIDARGIAKVSELEMPMTKLSKEQRGDVKAHMGDAEKVASGLAASVVTSLSAMPNRKLRIGESWDHEGRNPSLGPDARVKMTWTLEEVEGNRARLKVSGNYKADVLDQGTVTGHAVFALDHQHFTEIDMTTDLQLKGGQGQLLTTNKVTVSVAAGS